MVILEVENSYSRLKKACRTNKSRGRDISLLIIIPISSKKYEKSTKFGSSLDITFQQLRLMACKKQSLCLRLEPEDVAEATIINSSILQKIKRIHSFKPYIR